MVTALHTVRGQRHYRSIQSVEHIAQLPLPGLSLHFRGKIGKVHQHIPGHGPRIVFKPRRVAKSAGMQHQTTSAGGKTPYLPRYTHDLTGGHKVTFTVICWVTFQ